MPTSYANTHLSPACDISPLSQAKTTADFIAACADALSDSGFLLHDQKLAEIAAGIIGASPIHWSWHLPSEHLEDADVLFEFAFNASLNGGYFFRNADGLVVQWQSGGSGSQALLELIGTLRAEREMPGINLRTPAAVNLVLSPLFASLPHGAQRIAIAMSFADMEIRAGLDQVLASARTHDGYHFNLAHADALTRLIPSAFADDPFRKKAILALQMTTGYLVARYPNRKITCDLPIPSDYQIPRILHFAGVVSIPGTFAQKLLSGDLMPVDSADVHRFRALAVVACRRIAEMASVSDGVVDGALFTTYRKQASFHAEALPPMKCDSLWF